MAARGTGFIRTHFTLFRFWICELGQLAAKIERVRLARKEQVAEGRYGLAEDRAAQQCAVAGELLLTVRLVGGQGRV